MTDIDLCRKVKAGELNYLGHLIKKYQDKLRCYLSFLISGDEIIEDAIQNTFIKVYTNINQYNESYQFSSWIYRIAHNEALNLLRQYRHIITPAESEIIFQCISSKENIELELIKKEEILYLTRALNQLDIKYREPLLLFYYQDKSYDEIADILQINKTLVGVRITRAKGILKKLYYEKESHSHGR